jgi:hypothetical protein
MVKRVAYEKKIYPSCFPCLTWRTIVLGAADGKLSSCSLFRIIRPIALNWGYSAEPRKQPQNQNSDERNAFLSGLWFCEYDCPMGQKSFTPECDCQRKISKPSQPFLAALKASPAFPN